MKRGDIVTVAARKPRPTVMIDRIIGLPAASLRPTGGRLEDEKMTELTRLLALWLGIGWSGATVRSRCPSGS